MNFIFKIIFSGIMIAFFIMCGPWLCIWAINTLVHAGGVLSFTIPFTWRTWLAAIMLGGLIVPYKQLSSLMPSIRVSKKE